MSSVLYCLHSSISQILGRNVDKRSLFEQMEIVMLALDEICDGGIVLESDPTQVVQRVSLRSEEIPLGEQTLSQAIHTVKEQAKWSWFN